MREGTPVHFGPQCVRARPDGRAPLGRGRLRLETERAPLEQAPPTRRAKEPPRPRIEPVPSSPRGEPGGLVSLGRRGPGEGAARGQADLPLRRLLHLLLVPRDGAGVLQRSRDRRADERELRVREGRPRGASGPRRDLHGGDPAHHPLGRLAQLRLPHSRPQALLRGHVFPASRRHGPSGLPEGDAFAP